MARSYRRSYKGRSRSTRNTRSNRRRSLRNKGRRSGKRVLSLKRNRRNRSRKLRKSQSLQYGGKISEESGLKKFEQLLFSKGETVPTVSKPSENILQEDGFGQTSFSANQIIEEQKNKTHGFFREQFAEYLERFNDNSGYVTGEFNKWKESMLEVFDEKISKGRTKFKFEAGRLYYTPSGVFNNKRAFRGFKLQNNKIVFDDNEIEQHKIQFGVSANTILAEMGEARRQRNHKAALNSGDIALSPDSEIDI